MAREIRPAGAGARQIPPPDSQSLHVVDVAAPSQAPGGGTIAARVDVQNTSAGCAAFDIRWLADGQIKGQESIAEDFCQPAGTTRSYTTPVGPMPNGDNQVCVELRNILIGGTHESSYTPSGCLTVQDAGIDAEDVSMVSCSGDGETQKGQPATFDIGIENTNPQIVSVDAAVYADDQEIGRSQSHVPAGDTRSVSVSGGESLDTGDYAITTDLQNIQVASAGSYR